MGHTCYQVLENEEAMGRLGGRPVKTFICTEVQLRAH